MAEVHSSFASSVLQISQRFPVSKGDIFDRLKVIGRPFAVRQLGRRDIMAVCECKCGAVVAVACKALRIGRTQSCGCFHRQQVGNLNRSHGKSKSAEYFVWKSMKARCTNPRDKYFCNYGGRGVSVCDRWMISFENFLADMGPRPAKGYDIDRIDNDGIRADQLPLGIAFGKCATHKEEPDDRVQWKNALYF